jgi:UDP-glucose 4-epimerase
MRRLAPAFDEAYPVQWLAAMAVLVTGGAGYIGSHMVKCLRNAGRKVVVVDDLSAGHAHVLPSTVPIVVADVGDKDAVARVLVEHEVDAIVHFAAKIQVGESVTNPRLYWMGNVAATTRLLDCALDAGVKRFIFSSTAAVYGTPATVPIAETDATAPINPYGETKLAIERMLDAYARAYDFRFCALRYFNAAGADAESGLGERHDPETHLIPLVLDAATGRRSHVTVFGRDYATKDGTCVRDYVHVVDLADAHLAALRYLEGGGTSGAFNLGTGSGHSVAEVIETCRVETGREIRVVDGPRREGDPPVLVASPRKAEQTFGWRAVRSDLRRIVRDAWAAHQEIESEADDTAEIMHARRAMREKEQQANVR